MNELKMIVDLVAKVSGTEAKLVTLEADLKLRLNRLEADIIGLAHTLMPNETHKFKAIHDEDMQEWVAEKARRDTRWGSGYEEVWREAFLAGRYYERRC